MKMLDGLNGNENGDGDCVLFVLNVSTAIKLSNFLEACSLLFFQINFYC